MYFIVYKIINKINNKFYIGKHKTKDLNDGYMGSGKLIRRAIAKYGIEDFEKEILYIFDNEAEMNAKEVELVILSEYSYNLCEGGKGGFEYINRNGLKRGRKLSENTIEKMRSSSIRLQEKRKLGVTPPIKTKFKTGEENIGKIAQKIKYPNGTMQGRTHSERTKSLMSSSHTGKRNSQYGTCWISNGKENKKVLKEKLDYWKELGYNQGRIKI